MKKACCIILLFFLLSSSSLSHPGRTDKNGGHWDKETGTYHFHSGEFAGQSFTEIPDVGNNNAVISPLPGSLDDQNSAPASVNDTEALRKTVLTLIIFLCYGGILLAVLIKEFGKHVLLFVPAVCILAALLFVFDKHPLLFICTAATVSLIAFFTLKFSKNFKLRKKDN